LTLKYVTGASTPQSSTKLADSYMHHDSNYHIFFDNGEIIAVGEKLYRKDLARTLELLAEGGADAFYTGEVAEAIVDSVQAKGGKVTLEDLRGM